MLFKCKMCGGSLEVKDGELVAVCEYCGTKQTVPKTNSDTITNLFNRANNLRLKSEFDKAEQIYERIVEEDDSEAEAHWGIVLCKYGIEYVTDPQTNKKIPTCHRTLFESVITDPDYQAAIDYSDANQQIIYEQEARTIDKIQKNILSIVKDEKPFDVFICYKETDENGKRTIDSTIANDIYYQLIQEGFKVFYAAITLEDKLGQEYEPYIFAALNSAKVMLVIGTKPEYFNAVWVKNEWSRYIKLIKNDRSRLLIPCYRDMDAYDLPEEFAHLQAQDMSKIGFISDVVRGIKKILNINAVNQLNNEDRNIDISNQTYSTYSNAKSLLKRAKMYIEDENWEQADKYCEAILDIDCEMGEAYLTKLLVEYKCKDVVQLFNIGRVIDGTNYDKAIRFLDGETTNYLIAQNKKIKETLTKEKIDNLLSKANIIIDKSQSLNELTSLLNQLNKIRDYTDTDDLVSRCERTIKILKEKETSIRLDDYVEAIKEMSYGRLENYQNALRLLKPMEHFYDVDDLIKECIAKISFLRK